MPEFATMPITGQMIEFNAGSEAPQIVACTPTPATAPKKVLILRTCDADLKSHGGFQWPAAGPVSCPDWNPKPVCGGGLHGLLWGEGKGDLLDWSPEAKWLVVAVDESLIVNIDSAKCKFPRGEVVHCGDRLSATEYLISRLCTAASVVGSILTGGDGTTLTGGYRSTLTGGDDSILTGGYRSILTGGDGSILTGGGCSTLTGGYRSILTGGDGSILTGGGGSTLTGGYRSTLTGGDGSTLTGGDGSILTGGGGSTLTGGDDSILTGGYRSILTGGDGSILQLTFYDADKDRRRVVTLYVGEDGIEPHVAYRLDANNKPVKAKP